MLSETYHEVATIIQGISQSVINELLKTHPQKISNSTHREEVTPFVIKFQHFRIVYEYTETPTHQTGVVPDHRIEDLAMIVGKVEESVRHG